MFPASELLKRQLTTIIGGIIREGSLESIAQEFIYARQIIDRIDATRRYAGRPPSDTQQLML